jgi:hypothetical protein
MSPEAPKYDEALLDRLFGPVEEIETEKARLEESVSRARGRGLRFGGYGPPRPATAQPVEVVDDWESSEVGND